MKDGQELVLRKKGFAVTINQGKPNIESGTIRFDWKIEDEVLCELRPEKLLVIVKDRQGLRSDGNSGSYAGRRFVVKISDGHINLQFYRSGAHRIFFYLINPLAGHDKLLKQIVEETQKTYGGNALYVKSLPVRALFDICRDKETEVAVAVGLLQKQGVLSAFQVSLDIPQGIFAGNKFTDPITKFLYNMPFTRHVINLPFKHKAADECEFRKRALVGIVPFVVVSVCRIVLVVITLLQMIYLVIGRIIALFVGYRPPFLFAGFKELWGNHIYTAEVFWQKYFFRSTNCPEFLLTKWTGDNYRTYQRNTASQVIRNTDERMGMAKKVPITPLGITLLGFAVWLATKPEIQAVGAGILFAVLVGYVTSRIVMVSLRIKYPVSRQANWTFWAVGNDDPSLAQVLATISAVLVMIASFCYTYWSEVVTWIVEKGPKTLMVLGVIIVACFVFVVLVKFCMFLSEKLRGPANKAMKFLQAKTWPILILILVCLLVNVLINKFISPSAPQHVLSPEERLRFFLVSGCIVSMVLVFFLLRALFKSERYVKWSKKKEEAKQQKTISEQKSLEERRKIAYSRYTGSTSIKEEQVVMPTVLATEPCNECMKQSLGDKIRLIFQDTKADVCKPFEQ